MTIMRIRTVFQGWIGGPGLMTNYFARVGSWDQGAAQLAGDRVHNAMEAARQAFLDATNWKNDLVADEFEQSTGELLNSFNITDASNNGAGNTNLLPPSNQICVSWKTDGVVAGRRVRGRTFLGPLALSAAEGNGTPTAAALVSANAFGTAMGNAGLSDVRHVIWHRPTAAGNDGSHHDIAEFTIRDKFAVLRSRRD